MADERNETPGVVPARTSIEELLKDPRTTKAIAKVAAKHLEPERLLRLTLSAVRKTPDLKYCTPESLLGALMTTAAIGLEPNTPEGHAFLIPFFRTYRKKDGSFGRVRECQYIIGYKGFIQLAYRSPRVLLVTADAIHQRDEFESYISSESETGTFFKFRKALENRGPLVGSFCYSRIQGESGRADMATVLPLDEILKIRSKSETYTNLVKRVEAETAGTKKREYAEKTLAATPWVFWEGEMAAKSAIRRWAKQAPISRDMEIAAAIDEAASEGRLNMALLADPDAARAVIEGRAEVPEHEDAADEGEPPEMADANEDPAPQPRRAPAGRSKAAPKPEPEPAKKAPPRDDGKRTAMPEADPGPGPEPAPAEDDEPAGTPEDDGGGDAEINELFKD